MGKVQRAGLLLGLLTFLSGSNAYASVVTVVNSGGDPFAVPANNILILMPNATHQIDIYLDTEGQDIFGWDFTLLSPGSGEVLTVSGTNIGAGFSQSNGGYRQFDDGGDIALFGLNTTNTLLFTLDWMVPISGDSLLLSAVSNVTDGLFATQFLSQQTLATTSAVPLPPAFGLFLMSNAVFFLFGKRSKKSTI